MRTDEELAEELRAGDPGAFERLYERWRGPLFAFAARMLGGSEPARDAVQDTFLALWEQRHELPRVRSFRAWLFTAGRNRCLTWLRRRDTHARLDAARGPAAPAADAFAGLEAEDEVRLVRETLMGLSPEHREVLVLREYQGFSYREIAGITEATESAVKARLFRARLALAERLRPALTQGDEP
jgi:RNA polymerase sigma-70 factor, ECF subfamily